MSNNSELPRMDRWSSFSRFLHSLQTSKAARRREDQSVHAGAVSRLEAENLLLGICQHHQKSVDPHVQRLLVNRECTLQNFSFNSCPACHHQSTAASATIQARRKQRDRAESNLCRNHNAILRADIFTRKH